MSTDNPARSIPRPRLLLMEDSPLEAERLLLWLDGWEFGRFEVKHVVTLAETLELLKTEQWDGLLIDLHVPDSKGLNTFEIVREAAPLLPIVVQSCIELESLAVEAVARGAQDYLVKRHMTPDTVRRAVRYSMERARIENELRRSQERYQLALDGANDGIWDWDVTTGELYLSDRWKEMLDFDVGAQGHTLEDWLALVHPDDRKALMTALTAHLEGSIPHLEIEHRMLRGSGEWVWVMTRGLAVRNQGSQPTRMSGSLTDISKRKETEARLVYKALYDGLTGLPNRTLFLDRLRYAIQRSRRKTDPTFAVLFLDLDRFKIVNDSLGHMAGDQMLISIAQRLQSCMRVEDTIARFGGDEFAILVEEESITAEEVADKIQNEINSPVEVSGHSVFTSVSIGIARYSGGSLTPEELLRNADIAMYRAKKNGRSCYNVFEEPQLNWAMGRLQMEQGLREAVQNGELVCYYQPIVALDDGNITGFEALVRWQHPKRGLIFPGEFIPFAEEVGLVQDIGLEVLYDACRTMSEMYKKHPDLSHLTVSVNVSSHQFLRPNFSAAVARVIEETGMAPTNLVLELTETALMENTQQAVEMLQQIRKLGVQIYLDDFGTGYSSLSYLHRFPVDRLKIDRTFVDGLGVRMEDEAIVRAIMGLAEALKIEVIAEGIETQSQLEMLQGFNCRFGQGFLFSKAVDSGKAMKLAHKLPYPEVTQPVAMVAH